MTKVEELQKLVEARNEAVKEFIEAMAELTRALSVDAVLRAPRLAGMGLTNKDFDEIEKACEELGLDEWILAVLHKRPSQRMTKWDPLAVKCLGTLIEGMESGNLYVNVHPIQYPGSELREQIR